MRAGTLSTFLLGTWLPAAVFAGLAVHDDSFTPDHVLRVTQAQVPTGCESRQDIVANGTSPGPAIHLLPGSTSWIRVYNDMGDQNLTMHWHGLAQRMAPFSDGTPQASQWPIPPGHFFDYEIFTEVEDAGSYYYHSHVGMQAMSCTGPLIVDDCGGSPHHYDDERIFFFEDSFLKTEQQMADGLMNTPFVPTGETHGILLNGKGVAVGQTATTGPPGGGRGFFGGGYSSPPGNAPGFRIGRRDTSTVDQVGGSDACTLPVIDVDPGKTYRFRFVGATGLSYLSVALQDHTNLTIVQVDGGEYNAPVSTDHIQLGTGQRFDVMFKTKTMEELAADGNKTTFFIQFQTLDRPTNYVGYGVLRYSTSSPVPASPSGQLIATPTDISGWMEYTFQPLYPDRNQAPTAAEVTRRITIDAEMKIDDASGRMVWELAHLSWTEYTYQSPMLVDIYQRGQEALPDYDAAMKNYGWDPKTLSFPAKIGEVLEIVFQNTGAQAGPIGRVQTHPFHAHSNHYYDIGSGEGQYDADANNAKLSSLGYTPMLRDTTMLYRYADTVNPGAVAGWRAWRIRVKDAGVWMVHCHILAHMMMGMQSVWVVGDAADIQKIPTELSAGYFTYGGNVYGNTTYHPSVYQYFNGTNKCGPA
ncbi:multicopper oxidase-domain-containing protein [Lasiosphaeria ovina]|uniref:Multicopper oxidase-domain-containing protein n=1 Tax=Lasiosphaeria ovina TaxID=92902 RepID=A0AAE0KFJ2_9PEZI|nr:multicopper oxidase-domain-containing protein [Lasiosphaeria ovina]